MTTIYPIEVTFHDDFRVLRTLVYKMKNIVRKVVYIFDILDEDSYIAVNRTLLVVCYYDLINDFWVDIKDVRTSLITITFFCTHGKIIDILAQAHVLLLLQLLILNSNL